MDTPDNEDHTFSGVMFTIEVKTELPVDFIQITEISVRGGRYHFQCSRNVLCLFTMLVIPPPFFALLSQKYISSLSDDISCFEQNLDRLQYG